LELQKVVFEIDLGLISLIGPDLPLDD